MIMVSTIIVIMIIKTSLGDTCIGDHHHDNFGCYPLNNYVQTFHNYLINSLLSSTPCDNYENIPSLFNYLTLFTNPPTWI
jgi:hypothetical protein